MEAQAGFAEVRQPVLFQPSQQRRGAGILRCPRRGLAARKGAGSCLAIRVSNRSCSRAGRWGRRPVALWRWKVLRHKGDSQVAVPKSSACEPGSPGAARLLQGFLPCLSCRAQAWQLPHSFQRSRILFALGSERCKRRWRLWAGRAEPGEQQGIPAGFRRNPGQGAEGCVLLCHHTCCPSLQLSVFIDRPHKLQAEL